MRLKPITLCLLSAVVVAGVALGVIKLRRRSSIAALVSASEVGNAAEVKRLLSNGVGASSSYLAIKGLAAGEPGFVEKNPLIAAAEHGHVMIISLLLNHGAEIDATNEWGESALILACRENHYDAASVLIQRGANINIRDERGRTPLMWAVGYASPQVVELLLHNGGRGGIDRVGQSMADIASRRSEPERQQILDLISLKKE